LKKKNKANSSNSSNFFQVYFTQFQFVVADSHFAAAPCLFGFGEVLGLQKLVSLLLFFHFSTMI
jgi:hypothetical protein